jgi:hypothetical protein
VIQGAIVVLRAAMEHPSLIGLLLRPSLAEYAGGGGAAEGGVKANRPSAGPVSEAVGGTLHPTHCIWRCGICWQQCI